MRQVTTKELREFLMKYLREEKKVSERTSNYYNSVIRFIYDVVLDMPINYKQLPMYKKKITEEMEKEKEKEKGTQYYQKLV